MKKLLLDIETAPNLAHVWGLWDQNIGLPQIIEPDYLLCWCAKWADEDDYFFSSLERDTPKRMMKKLHHLLDEADAVIHYNGKRFDIPWINREFIVNGMLPPSPYKEIDLLETVKKTFKFPSNKLEYIVKALGVGEKLKTIGHELWIGCMKGDPDSWAQMEEYNINDVFILEKVYQKLLPWIRGHANHSLLNTGMDPVCPNCGSNRLHKRGYAFTLASKFQRYRCRDCGHWSKDNKVLNRTQYKTTSIQ